ncbi:MAG TPA: tetratricopeptide repeat protein [Longimicrobiaceae bacterium]|nr:tetratricopeptide repeat protein [Longimicrobiaceae bacterium]
MSLSRSAAAVLAFAMLAACGGRRPPPPAPAPLAAPVDSTEIVRLQRVQAQAFFDQATRLGRQARWGEAVALYRRAVAAAPDEATYHFGLSSALLGGGSLGEAADAFQAGIDVEERATVPNHRLLAEDYERLIQILTRAGRTEAIGPARDRQRYHRELRDVLLPR